MVEVVALFHPTARLRWRRALMCDRHDFVLGGGGTPKARPTLCVRLPFYVGGEEAGGSGGGLEEGGCAEGVVVEAWGEEGLPEGEV
jgi:hypothetical protein